MPPHPASRTSSTSTSSATASSATASGRRHAAPTLAVAVFLLSSTPAPGTAQDASPATGGTATSEAATNETATNESVTSTPADAPGQPIEAAYQVALAKMLAEESAFREAQRAFERALEIDDSDPYLYVEAATFHADLAYVTRSPEGRRRQLELAAGHARRAQERMPENADALRIWAEVNMRLAESQPSALGEAQEAYEKLRTLSEGDIQVLSSLAQLYLWRREPAKAAEVLQEAARYVPNHRMIQNMLVESLLEAGDLQAAEPALVRLLELDPGSLEGRLRLAEVLSQRGAHREAVMVLRRAPEELAGEASLRRTLARELHLSGDDQHALALVDELLANGAGSGQLQRLKVAILMALTRYSETVSLLEAILAADVENPRRVQDELLLSRLLERLGRPDEAAARLRARLAQTDDEGSLQLRLSLVGVLERHDRHDEAVALLERRLAKAGLEEMAVLAPTLGEVLVAAGRPEEGLQVVREAASTLRAEARADAAVRLQLLELRMLSDAGRWDDLAALGPELLEHPNDDLRLAGRGIYAEALAELGRLDESLALLAESEAPAGQEERFFAIRTRLLFEHGRADAADAGLRALTADEGAEPDDLLFAAQLYQQAERYAEAAELARRYLEAEPESRQALFLLGAASERQGQHTDSVTTFQRLLADDPDFAPALNYLGYMWAERGENLEQAERLILRAVALDPDNGAYVDSLGWVYYQRGAFEAARQHLEWAARLVPEDATVLEHLGDVYRQLGDLERARELYEASLELEGEQVDSVRGKLEALADQGP